MKLEHATVLSQEEVYGDTYLMWLSCPPVARGATPGRFLMVHPTDSHDPLLARPMSYHRFRLPTPALSGAEGSNLQSPTSLHPTSPSPLRRTRPRTALLS